ncbi:FAD-binding oxidoreductase [Rhodobacterales bacterium]|nr:FAD-binding oxidoreductase [Rhodobacterales bacterium]
MVTVPFSILWRESSAERMEAAPLTRSLDVDLLIVGGGFTGTSAALEGARRGASVCLLEAETFGHGGSGRNVGLVNAGLWLPPDAVIEQMGEAAGTRLNDALGKGPGDVFSLIEREDIACEATRNGTLHLAHSPDGLKNLEDRYRQGNRHGAPLRLLDADETARRTGTNVFHGSLHDPRAGTVQPLAYCRGLARVAIARGATLCEHSPVTSLQRQKDMWVAEANGHTVRARKVLIATNAYHLGIEAPFKPAFIRFNYCQFATTPLSPELQARILPGGEGCWDTAMVMSSVRVDAAGRLIIGGMGSLEDPGKGFHESWARRKLQALYPELADIDFDHGWSGRIAMTSDHIPKVVAFGPGAYACFGYSGRGIAPGTVFGTAAAAALLDETEALLPVTPIESHSETFTEAKAAYYELGAKLAHAVSAR